MLERIMQAAAMEIGTEEQPRKSNSQKYGQEYGIDKVPWCVIFLWWVFISVKATLLFYGGRRCASCSQLFQWAQSVGQAVPTSEARRGDILFFNFDGLKTPEHCGIMVKKEITGKLSTIEGNTPNADGDNDGVYEKLRDPRHVVGVWRPKYEDSRDFDGRWSTAAILEALNDGAMNGYPDGSFMPDRNVTREELAQFYCNLKKLWRC